MSNEAITWAFAQALPPKCKMVLVALANRANADGECWPSVATIMGETGVSERTVQEALRFLDHHGAIERRDRPGTSRVYTMTMQAVSAPKNMHPQRFKTSEKLAPPQNSHPLETRTPTPPETRTPPPAKLAPKPLLNHQEKESKKDISKTYTLPLAARVTGKPVVYVGADGFDGFWHLYPRKVGKGAARKAWAAAVGKTSAAEIMAGLARWQPPSDAKFTPHPATWLNSERWADEEPDNSLDARLARASGRAALEAENDWLDATPSNVIPMRLP